MGAMFRTCDAAGVGKIYLTGYTPTPLDRFGRKRKDVAKSALGAEEFVAWEQRKNLTSLISNLKSGGFYVIAIEQDPKSVDYRKLKPKSKKLAFLAGSEVSGLPKNILKTCDAIAEIPMHGRKESLNVSVALGVVLYSMLDF